MSNKSIVVILSKDASITEELARRQLQIFCFVYFESSRWTQNGFPALYVLPGAGEGDPALIQSALLVFSMDWRGGFLCIQDRTQTLDLVNAPPVSLDDVLRMTEQVLRGDKPTWKDVPDTAPAPEYEETQPAVWDLVMADFAARDKMGRQKYGTPLQPFNGRNALRDMYEEMQDMIVYARQRLTEEEAIERRRAVAQQMTKTAVLDGLSSLRLLSESIEGVQDDPIALRSILSQISEKADTLKYAMTQSTPAGVVLRELKEG